MHQIFDIANHQKKIDWAELKKNCGGVIIRHSCGDTIDKSFKKNVEQCINNNIPFGIYVYFKSNKKTYNGILCDYVKQLHKAIFSSRYYKFIAIDIENIANIKIIGDNISKLAKVLIGMLRASQIKAVVYTNPDMLIYKGLKFSNAYLWLAYWGVSQLTAERFNFDIWQYKKDYTDFCSTEIDFNVITNTAYEELFKNE